MPPLEILPVQFAQIGRATSTATRHTEWGGMQRRERVGMSASTALASAMRYPSVLNDRLLSANDCWTLYQRCVEVRSCVNGIALRVSGAPWRIVPRIPSTDPRHEAVREACESVRRFLTAPTADGSTTWATYLIKVVIDACTFGASATELVENQRRELAELNALRGSDVLPLRDEFGVVLGYRQDPAFSAATGAITVSSSREYPTFEPSAIVFFELFPNTTDPRPLPILESIFNECLTILSAAHHVLVASDADEIPPGILVMAGVADKAIDRLRQDFEAKGGQDHKIRIAQAANAQAMGVQWVQMTRSMRDQELKDVVDKTRRAIWRAFGVMPIEQGETDGAPRASTETQVDVSTSHLLDPLLDRIEEIVNTRIVPRLIDPELAGLVKYEFVRERKRSEAATAALATAIGSMVDRGVITRNEARAMISEALLPLDGGDVATVTLSTSSALVPIALSGSTPDDDGEPVAPEEPADGVDGGAPDPEDAAPGEVDAEGDLTVPWPQRVQFGATRRGLGAASDGAARALPADWKDPARFRGRRVLDLPALGAEIERYDSDVAALWREAREQVVSATAAAVADGRLTPSERTSLEGRIKDALDGLGHRWSAATRPRYIAAAKIGATAASEFAKVPAVNSDGRASVYHLRAMGWLTDADGPLAAVRKKCTKAIDSAGKPEARHVVTRGVGDLIFDNVDRLLSLIGLAWDTEEHRIGNWSGRTNDLASDVLADDLLHLGAPPTADGNPPGEWWCQWVRTQDDESCADCMREATKGFQPLARLSIRPGGGTACRANCRCTLVMWTKAEVDSGEAVLL